jgi:Na+-transporting NADH:ubiquinone oxidoreductase subunit C
MQQFSTKYIFLFSLALCLACSVLLAAAAVTLKKRQEENQKLDKQKSVLQAANLVMPGEPMTPAIVKERFQSIEPKVIDLDTDTYVEGIDAAAFDPESAPMKTPPENSAQIKSVPGQVQIFHVLKDGKLDKIVLPIFGKGLWGTLYGYLALAADTTTVEGITYYDHKETPGLGGEVDNPKWKNRWPGRKVYGDSGAVALHVIKGPAGPPAEDPHSVDGLSGATLTSRGVTNMLQFWLGDEGYGPYLKSLREQGSK